MAKHPRRKFNMRRVRLTGNLDVGALAAADLIAGPLVAVAADTYRCISIDASYVWKDVQATIDDGAQFGVSHSDYSASEVEECLEATGSIDLGDKVAQERANRLVREIGIFASSPDGASGGVPFNNGMPVKTRLNWLLSIGDVINLWVRNSSGVVYTTGSALGCTGNMWVKN